MTTLSIIVYGNGDLYYQYFKAICLSLGGGTYPALIKLSILLAGTSVLFSYVMKRDLSEIIKWLASVYVVIYILFLPQVTVEIIDRVSGDPPKAYTVDHVPLGLAVFASVSTSLSDVLTQLTEMNFTMPDDLRYQKNGMIFASEMVRAASQFQITDARFDGNIQGFIHQCVFYDILLKKYSMNDLLEEKNIWALVTKRASPARGFIYTDASQLSQFTTCSDSVTQLTQDWVNAVEDAKQRYGSRLFSGATDPKEQLKKYLDISFGYLTSVSGQADKIMKQTLLANAIERGVLRMGATLNATAALQSYAFVRGQEQKRLTNTTVGEMAAYWLPLIKNNLELILYGSFIFVVLLSVFPFGAATLKSYLYTLVWVQLWPPLYAVLNLTVSYYAQRESLAATGKIISLQTLPGLLQVNTDIAGLAGYLSMSVPALAGGLLWGMHSLLQVSQYVGGMTQSAASVGAGEAVTGNIGFGNTNFGNHNAFNTSNNHVDTNARVSTGASMLQLADGSQLSVMPNGNEAVNMQNSISNIGASVDFSNAYRTSFTEGADHATSAAKQDNNNYSKATNAALRSAYDIANHLNKSDASGESWSLNATSGVTNAFNKVKGITNDLSNRLNISTDEAANLAASIYADGKAGLSGSIGASVGKSSGGDGFSPIQVGAKASADFSLSGSLGGSRTATHNSSTHQGNLYSEAKAFLDNEHYSENVDTIARAAQDKSLRTNNEEGNRLVDSMAASFDTAESYRQDMQSNLQQADTYRINASKAEEYASRVGIAGQQELTEFIAKQPNRDGVGTLGTSSVAAVMHTPELRDKYINQFMKEHFDGLEKPGQHHLPSSSQAVEKIYHQNNQSIKDDNVIHQVNQQNRSAIGKQGVSKGLIPNQLVDHSIKKQVENDQAIHRHQVAEVNKEVNQAGEVIKTQVEQEKTQKRHGGLAHDFVFDIDTKNHDQDRKH